MYWPEILSNTSLYEVRMNLMVPLPVLGAGHHSAKANHFTKMECLTQIF